MFSNDKNINRSNSLLAKNYLCTWSTLFFTFLSRCCCILKLPSYTYYWENMSLLLMILFPFLFTAAHCHRTGRKHFSFSVRPINFSCCFSKEICFLCLSLAVTHCLSFSLLAPLACLLLSRFLCLFLSLHSQVVDISFRRHGYRNNFCFPFCLYWPFNCLCFTRRGWPCDFRQKNSSSIWAITSVDWLFYIR